MHFGWKLLIAIAAIGTGAFLSRAPWEAYREQQGRASKAQQEMREAEDEAARLLREKNRASSPIGREAMLRGRGYVKKDEKPVEPE